jgi:hypothetical protein
VTVTVYEDEHNKVLRVDKGLAVDRAIDVYTILVSYSPKNRLKRFHPWLKSELISRQIF